MWVWHMKCKATETSTSVRSNTLEFGFLVTIELDMSYGSAGEGRREESLEENVVALYIVIYDMHE